MNMKRLIAAFVVIGVVVFFPCVANGAGGEDGKQPITVTSPEAMSRAGDGARVSARVGMASGAARGAVRARPGVDLRSVQDPGDLVNALASGSSPDIPPAAPYWLAISGTNFAKVNGTGNTIQGANGCVSTTDGAQLAAPVFLPSGAMVQELWLNYSRTGAYVSAADFYWFDYLGTSGGIYLQVAATGTSGNSFDAVSGGPFSIDNASNSYIIGWFNTANSGNKLCSVQLGYTMPPTGTYNPVTPCRKVDTRSGSPLTPLNRSFQMTGSPCNVPAGATAVTANVTVVNTSASGYVAIFPQGTSWPGNSTLNYTAGQIVANAADLVLSGSGQVTAFCYTGTTDLVIDITGYFY
jgi:hypothetical protein